MTLVPNSTYYECGECTKESIAQSAALFACCNLGMTSVYSSWVYGYILLVCTVDQQRSTQSRPWSVCIGLLDGRAPMTSHNLDNTGMVHLGAMMFSLRGSSSSQVYCRPKMRGEASLRLSAFSDIAFLTFAYNNRLRSYIVPTKPPVCLREHRPPPNNRQFVSSLSIAVQHTKSQPCSLVD